MKRIWMIGTLIALSSATVACGAHKADRRNREAREFIEALVPKLHAYSAENGLYPEAIPSDWYSDRAFPKLLRTDFYMTFNSGQEFLMRFRDQRWWDPRFCHNDIVAYQSDIGHWAQWDGY
jgi:hypothetical protein